MIKLIASDMDGTLLNTNRNIDKEFYDLFETLKSRNIIFVAVSGRETKSLKSLFKENVRDDIVFAPNNGNIIIYRDKILFENYIQTQKLKTLAKIIRQNAIDSTIYCAKYKTYSESIKVAMNAKEWNTEVDVVNDITKIDDKIMKVSVFGDEDTIHKTFDNLKVIENSLSISLSGPKSLDICEIGGNKKQAINVLQNIFNINYDETMIFGDHMNDLEMMQSGYYSFAMENATNEVKKSARFITKDNDNKGVIDAIRDIIIDSKVNA